MQLTHTVILKQEIFCRTRRIISKRCTMDKKTRRNDGCNKECAFNTAVHARKEVDSVKGNVARCGKQKKWHSPMKFSRGSVDFSPEEEDDSLLLLRENTNLHGLRDLLFSSSCQLRITWIILLFFAAILTLHGCYMIMMEFFMRRVVVSYFIQEASVLALPDIVICPFNRFNKSYLEQLNVTAGLAQYLEISYPSPVIHPFQERTYVETIENIDVYEYELELLLSRIGNITYTEFLKKASIDCTAFFKDHERCKNLTEIMTSAGKCFRLRGVDQLGDGFGYGERIVINLPHELYNPGSNQMLNDGIAVKLAERGKGIDHDLTFIPAGVHAIMPLKATQYEFMNDPPRYNCEEDADNTYSRVWCFEVCLTKNAEDQCNCSLAAATKPAKEDICTTKQIFHCFLTYLFPENSTTIVENCKRQCKTPCSYWQYDKTVSYATFPSKVAKFFVANESEWNQLKSTIVLEVFFTDLDYTVIKHVVAMPLSSVIAQIGGQFSLFAGGSLISLFQIVIYLGRHLYHKCVQCYKRKKKSKRKRKADVNRIQDEDHCHNGSLPYLPDLTNGIPAKSVNL